MKIRRIFELIYLGIAAFCAVEAFVSYRANGIDHRDTMLYIVLFILALIMYTARKWQRRRMENLKK